MYADKVLTCADCGQEFVFSSREQEFYASRQFSEPRRCGACRASRKASRGDTGGSGYAGRSYGDSYADSSAGGSSYGSGSSGGYGGASRGPREMFSTICSSCGKEAQVPFRPTSGKPVYCSDCFALRRA